MITSSFCYASRYCSFSRVPSQIWLVADLALAYICNILKYPSPVLPRSSSIPHSYSVAHSVPSRCLSQSQSLPLTASLIPTFHTTLSAPRQCTFLISERNSLFYLSFRITSLIFDLVLFSIMHLASVSLDIDRSRWLWYFACNDFDCMLVCWSARFANIYAMPYLEYRSG